MRRTLCAVLLALACAAVASGPADALSATAVTVDDNVFRARATTVRTGAAVTWTWRGDRRHNIVFVSGRTGKPRGCSARRAGSCTRTFSGRGKFAYVCTFHGSMAGLVRVRDR